MVEVGVGPLCVLLVWVDEVCDEEVVGLVWLEV